MIPGSPVCLKGWPIKGTAIAANRNFLLGMLCHKFLSNTLYTGMQADAVGVLGDVSLTSALGPVDTTTLFASVADVTLAPGASGSQADKITPGGSNVGAKNIVAHAKMDAAVESGDRRLIPVCVPTLLYIISCAYIYRSLSVFGHDIIESFFERGRGRELMRRG